MNAMFSGRVFVNKLIDFVDRINGSREQDISIHAVGTLQQEIYHIEKTLADTQPNRIIRKAKPLEPLTEQQKIIDLAG